LLKQALGPTADYIGEGLKQFTAKRIENINRIFHKFINKLGEKINEPGQVHPKLLKSVIADGSFCDDELTAEYYGSVLASSRSCVSRDDRGVTYVNLISRLSTYQIRTHFIIYTIMRNLFVGERLNVGYDTDRHKMKIYVQSNEYKRAMDFWENEDLYMCCSHALSGLKRENLIERIGVYGSIESLKKYSDIEYPSEGFIVAPDDSGIELYLWANGHGNRPIKYFLSPDISFESPKGIEIPKNAFSLIKEKERQKKESQQSKS